MKQSMENWEVEKKWLMINQDHQAELLASGIRHSRIEEAVAERASLDISRLPNSQVNYSVSNPFSKATSQQPNTDGFLPTKSISSPVHKSTTPATPNILRPINTNTTANASNISPIKNSPTQKYSPTINRSKSMHVTPTSPSNSKNDHFYDTNAVDQYSQEFFVRKFLDPNLRSVTPKIAASLEVSLRTRSIE